MRIAAALRHGEHDRSVGQRVRPAMLELIVCARSARSVVRRALRRRGTAMSPVSSGAKTMRPSSVQVPPADSAGRIDDASRAFRRRGRHAPDRAAREIRDGRTVRREERSRCADGVRQFLIGAPRPTQAIARTGAGVHPARSRPNTRAARHRATRRTSRGCDRPEWAR